MNDIKIDPFKEYQKESNPDKARKGYAWSTAIGLQAVDGLKPSDMTFLRKRISAIKVFRWMKS